MEGLGWVRIAQIDVKRSFDRECQRESLGADCALKRGYHALTIMNRASAHACDRPPLGREVEKAAAVSCNSSP